MNGNSIARQSRDSDRRVTPYPSDLSISEFWIRVWRKGGGRGASKIEVVTETGAVWAMAHGGGGAAAVSGGGLAPALVVAAHNRG
jgi:hypothetical protein